MKPSIVWQTDFGLNWGAVASMRGVCMQVDSELQCFDITHNIEQYNILAASREIVYVEPFWPKPTVFVSVVDPGVGTSRRACVARLSDGNYVVTPDNGTLTHLFYQIGIAEVRKIDESVNRYRGTEDVSVFHGRDIFAYTAAKLAAGQITYEEVGEAYPLEEIVLFEKDMVQANIDGKKITAIVSSTGDPFGSIAFNILTSDFVKAGYRHGDMVHVVLKKAGEVYFDRDVLYERSFGFVEQGEPILFNSSTNYIELGLNMDSFKDRYNVGEGKDYQVFISDV